MLLCGRFADRKDKGERAETRIGNRNRVREFVTIHRGTQGGGLVTAIGSSGETQLWLRDCIDLGYVEEVTGRKWIEGYVEISRILRGLHASWLRSS